MAGNSGWVKSKRNVFKYRPRGGTLDLLGQEACNSGKIGCHRFIVMHAGREEMVYASANQMIDAEFSKESTDSIVIDYSMWADALRTSSAYMFPEQECNGLRFSDHERMLWEREFCLIKHQQHTEYSVEELSPEMEMFLKLW
eukprot:754933-Hanusia_phi.AAC.11